MSGPRGDAGSARRVIDADWRALLGSAIRPPRALFLDRDGVINVDRGYVHTREETEWQPGIFDLCKAAHESGHLIVVITNQAGIARGLYTEDDFVAYTRWMHREFASRGAPILATFYCPHHPTAGAGPLTGPCTCRKPMPGMIRAALDEFAIDPSLSWLIGDKQSDVAAAEAAGIGTIVDVASNPRPPQPGTPGGRRELPEAVAAYLSRMGAVSTDAAGAGR